MSLRFEWRGPFAFATLDRAEARNALTDEMVRALHTAVAEVAARPDARALVIRGSGGHFCAGGDFAAFKSLIARPAPATGPDPIATMNRAHPNHYSSAPERSTARPWAAASGSRRRATSSSPPAPRASARPRSPWACRLHRSPPSSPHASATTAPSA